MLNIPVLDANDSILEADFEGVSYFVRMSWNSEGEFWTLTLEDYAHNVIVAGVAVVPDTPLLAMFRHLGTPAGEIWAVLLNETRQTIGRSDFVTGDAALVYIEEGEDVAVSASL